MFFTGLQQCPGRFRMRPDLLMKWPTGSGSVIQDYGFADPDPKENIYRSILLLEKKKIWGQWYSSGSGYAVPYLFEHESSRVRYSKQ